MTVAAALPVLLEGFVPEEVGVRAIESCAGFEPLTATRQQSTTCS
ncbi:MAG: hypothetical protein AVDCRST_MAG68-3204 [uncultured Gemmatimonadetes bacterium]|uniref:Uncharacterized protein n=1 Tax=uncultured Gemmatimonadota bacterium TaxID=203437 RepID=A0A6J4LXH5_9BACT|nr:MAG: hypothetical protein AVDCRST_MAG68-3204 [uncultured Gemmatimonadota bacterium]